MKWLIAQLLLVIVTLASPCAAQCIPDGIDVTALRGRVVSTTSRGAEPLVGAEVQLRRDSGIGKVLQSVRTDGDGWFAFKGLGTGHYVLLASYPELRTFAVRIRMRRSASAKGLLINLGVGTDECGGGWATPFAQEPVDSMPPN